MTVCRSGDTDFLIPALRHPLVTRRIPATLVLPPFHEQFKLKSVSTIIFFVFYRCPYIETQSLKILNKHMTCLVSLKLPTHSTSWLFRLPNFFGRRNRNPLLSKVFEGQSLTIRLRVFYTLELGQLKGQHLGDYPTILP